MFLTFCAASVLGTLYFLSIVIESQGSMWEGEDF